MNVIPYQLKAVSIRHSNSAIVTSGDLAEEVVNSILSSISTDVEVVLGDITVHLAMLQDPDHWQQDWEELGIEDPDSFLASLVEVETF